MEKRIANLYEELFDEHGDPEKVWPQWCSNKKNLYTRQLIVIGAILVQRTSWHNANIALKNLKKKNLISLKKLSEINKNELSKYIRKAGFHTTKPKRLIEVSNYFTNNGGMKSLMKKNKTKLRKELLGVYGIGPETADVLLLYALDKPSFVIDEYTKRFVKKQNLSKDLSYDFLKKLFENSLEKDIEIYQKYHALIIIDQTNKKHSYMEVV